MIYVVHPNMLARIGNKDLRVIGISDDFELILCDSVEEVNIEFSTTSFMKSYQAMASNGIRRKEVVARSSFRGRATETIVKVAEALLNGKIDADWVKSAMQRPLKDQFKQFKFQVQPDGKVKCESGLLEAIFIAEGGKDWVSLRHDERQQAFNDKMDQLFKARNEEEIENAKPKAYSVTMQYDVEGRTWRPGETYFLTEIDFGKLKQVYNLEHKYELTSKGYQKVKKALVDSQISDISTYRVVGHYDFFMYTDATVGVPSGKIRLSLMQSRN